MAMATAQRRARPSLAEWIFENAHEIELRQAIRLIQRLFTDRIPIGYGGPPDKECVRLYGVHELATPTGTVRDIADAPPYMRPERSPVPVHLRTPSGLADAYDPCALPNFYVEQLRRALDVDRNQVPAEFMDLFNHRLLSLEYRAWERPRFSIRYERKPDVELERQTPSYWLYCLMGAGIEPLAERLTIPDRRLLRYSGYFLPVTRPSANLEGLLRDVFRLPVSVHSFQGRWSQVAASDRASLTASSACGLGEGSILGDKTWYQQASIRICVGPLSLRQFVRFLPGSRKFGELVEFANHYARGAYEQIEVELLLPRTSVPACRLRRRGIFRPRLGWLSSLPQLAESKRDGILSVLFRSTEVHALRRAFVEDALLTLRRRLGKQRLKLEWNNEVVETLKRVADARPTSQQQLIRSMVGDEIEAPLRRRIEAGQDGAKRVRVSVIAGSICFEVA